MTLRKSVSLLATGFCLLTLLGCEVRTSVKVESGPTFSFDGSGRLVFFRVYGPRPGRKIATPVDAQSLMWSIEPASDSPSGASVTGMEIAYGKVPRSYLQKFPSSGAALPLVIGKVYVFDAETTGAPGVNGFVYMSRNGPIQINVPGLCGSAFVGDVKPVRCGTKEPYVEPKDLEEFVRENRVQISHQEIILAIPQLPHVLVSGYRFSEAESCCKSAATSVSTEELVFEQPSGTIAQENPSPGGAN
jgi:hypothetical protein